MCGGAGDSVAVCDTYVRRARRRCLGAGVVFALMVVNFTVAVLACVVAFRSDCRGSVYVFDQWAHWVTGSLGHWA